MLILAKPRRRQFIHDIASHETGGTAQTKARLRPDTLVTMFERGTLEGKHLLAAAEIRNIFEALTRPMGLKIMTYEPRIGSPVRRGYQAPIERMSPRLLDLYQRRYKPWADQVGGLKTLTPAGHVRTLEVAISVVVDGAALADLARRWRLRRRTGIRLFGGLLRDGLGAYCRIGGIG